ncbi:hypothetical protein TIFTF001_012999 [Ficus carica]|uniref:Uncharacterized protein n=1 Tax=Ficus carica TaxID=3494 RepID=A0AA88A124_FICCA|nr:hypothetical protein TIFTF001_012999 [Ficus carica]
MPKIFGTTPDVVVRTKKYLHGYSASGHLQKEKHLEVIGTPALPSGSGIRVIQSGRLPSAPGVAPVGAGGGSWRCDVCSSRWGKLTVMCAVTGFTSDVRWWLECCDSEVVNSSRVPRLPRKSLLVGSTGSGSGRWIFLPPYDRVTLGDRILWSDWITTSTVCSVHISPLGPEPGATSWLVTGLPVLENMLWTPR